MTVAKVALAEVGYVENSGNQTKYGEWFGLQFLPWCGIFVSWVYFMAGMALPKIGFTKGFAGCQTAVAYFKQKKMITTVPVEGDIVFFDWNGDGRYDHTGIFLKWIDSDTFETVEGNTSHKNQSNGGEVMIRQRNKRVAIFVHV